MSKKLKQPDQGHLFRTEVTCPDVGSLPLILDPRGGYEVLAPGSVYQPILLTPDQEGIEVGPGKLDKNEEKFVRDLIRFLYPDKNPPRSNQTPLQWGDKEIWLKRNIEKVPGSFRLRVDDSDWFYPDFILWILDRKTRTQTFGFVDPKGLAIGAVAGWGDFKVVSTLFVPHVIERQLAGSAKPILWEGEEWTFRVRGVLVSTSSLEGLLAQAKFRVRDESGYDRAAAESDFERGRIVFQKEGTSYIDKVLRLLAEDSPMDGILARAAAARSGEPFTPKDEIDFDLALRNHEAAEQTDCEFVDALVRDYLKPDARGDLGGRVRERRRNELYKHAKDGVLGIGAEKVKDLRDHPAPCAELWRRKKIPQ